MEQVIEADSSVIFHRCSEGRGIGLIKRTGAALQHAAAGVKWRGWRDSSPSPSPSPQGRGGVPKSPLPWWERDRERGRRRVTQPHAPPVATQRCDSRYRGIISRLDALLELFRREPERNLAAELDLLLEAMSEQFANENDCMILVGFPQALVHSVRHQAISFEAAKVRYRFSTGRPVRYSELALLRMLCMEHIESYDANFERFLAPRSEAQPC